MPLDGWWQVTQDRPLVPRGWKNALSWVRTGPPGR